MKPEESIKFKLVMALIDKSNPGTTGEWIATQAKRLLIFIETEEV